MDDLPTTQKTASQWALANNVILKHIHAALLDLHSSLDSGLIATAEPIHMATENRAILMNVLGHLEKKITTNNAGLKLVEWSDIEEVLIELSR